MPTYTLPTQTRTIDNAFLTTWYDLRPEAIDNILNATVVWAALNQAGCLKEQVGGEYITRTIRYGEVSASEIEKGDLLPQPGETELETGAFWRWKTIAIGVQRDLHDDQRNRGPAAIKSLIGTKLTAAKDALDQKMESQLFNAQDTTESTKRFQGLHDILPPISGRSTGTYGGITRASGYGDSGNGVYVPNAGNTWWGPKYLPGTLASVEDDLLSDMKKLYNSVHNNQSPPNLIITTQALFEIFEEFAEDQSQIIKDATTTLANLGFEVLRFKGKPLVWTPSMTANHMMMLNTDFLEILYDPDYWFAMTDWKTPPLMTVRVAHILSFMNAVTSQPRRHGRLEYA